MEKSPPTLLEFPNSFSSPRLEIRLPLPGDGEELNRAINESFDLLKMWMPWARVAPTATETEEHVRRSNSRFLLREDLQLLLFDRKTKELIGSSGLHPGDWEVPRFEIGYWIRKKYLNQGFAREAVLTIVEFAFSHLKARRLEIHVASHNHASKKVAIASGFELEATLKNFELSLIDQKLVDKLIFVKTR